MNTEFPDDRGKYLKASDFQDTEICLTFEGWVKKANYDDPPEKKNAKTWKNKLKYMLRYSYPEFATDEAGEKLLNDAGETFQNRYWDPEFPKGYSIVYSFSEGDLESGSLPLWRAFCRVKPKPAETIIISRNGEEKDTKWSIRRVTGKISGVNKTEISDDYLGPSMDVPFA